MAGVGCEPRFPDGVVPELDSGGLVLPRIAAPTPPGEGSPFLGSARRPIGIGHPPPSAAARAWPNFVPRLELDAELKGIEGKLQELNRRLSHQEARQAESKLRIDELKGRCEEQLATRVSLEAVKVQVELEVASCREDFQEAVDRLYAFAAAEAHLQELRAAHEQRLGSLDEGLAAAGREAASLRDALSAAAAFCEANYAPKLALATECDARRKGQWELERRMREAEAVQDQHAAAHRDVNTDMRDIRAKHEQSVLAASVTSSLLDGLTEAVSELGRHCDRDLATREELAELSRALASVREAQATAASGLDGLKAEVANEQELVRRTVFNYAGSFAEVHSSLAEVHRLCETKVELKEKVAMQDVTIFALDKREGMHWEAWQQGQQDLQKQMEALETLLRAVRAEMLQHVARWELAAPREYGTSACVQQMDEALTLTKSVDQLVRLHKEMSDTIKSGSVRTGD